MNVEQICSEKAKISYHNINYYINSAIMRKNNHSRILYAGVNPNNEDTIVVMKIVELFRGRYYYQETVFNPTIKSVHSTLTTLNHENFHYIIPANDKVFNLRFHQNPQIVAATSYAREIGSKTFKNIIVKDYRNNQGYLTPIFDVRTVFKMKNYLS